MRSAQIFDAASRTLEQLSSLSASVIPALSTALLVAKHLGDSEHERWLGCELRGYKNPTSGSSFTTLAEALQVPETTELIRRIGDYRTMQTFFYVSGPQGLEKWPYPFFVPDSASKIESSSGIYASAPIISAEVKALPALLEIMRSAGLPGDTVTIHFTYRQYSAVVSGLRTELIDYLSGALLRLSSGEETMKSSAQPPGVSTGNISGGNFTIINNTGAAATITIGASSKMGGKKAISQLREEVAAIQDLLIGSYKQHLEFAEYADLTKEALLKIIELMEQKVENQQIDDQYLRTVAQEAVINALRAKQVEPSILRRLVGNGVSQSLIASVIFEAIKAAPDIMALLG